MSLIKVLACIFLPPLGAFMAEGLGLHFLLNIVLTILGGFPGMLHALWLNVRKK